MDPSPMFQQRCCPCGGVGRPSEPVSECTVFDGLTDRERGRDTEPVQVGEVDRTALRPLSPGPTRDTDGRSGGREDGVRVETESRRTTAT